MLQWTEIVLYYEFRWKFASWFSFRFIVICYRFEDGVCYILWFPSVMYYQALDFISAKFSLFSPKGICFFTYHTKQELLWNTVMLYLYLYVRCMSFSWWFLRCCLGWDSSETGGLDSEQVQAPILPASQNEGM